MNNLNNNRKIRVRYAPSPTGFQHIGGIRTALYNYLFAKKMGGDFILRIEDTDDKRFVDGSIDYIINSLKWLGIEPNEGYGFGDGNYGPYIQSKRLDLYNPIIKKLLDDGNAYYAFDTSDDLDDYKKIKNFKYNCFTRDRLNNSLNMSKDKLKELLDSNVPYVIRAKVPKDKTIIVNDLIRGMIKVSSNELDDKVLVKSDGVPTYHLASTVDDYLMNISHVLRGDEWLASAPLHILIHEWIGNTNIPEFLHLSVILRPDGKKKLGKRDGDELGICVFPLKYLDDDNNFKDGYKELGYLPEALLNILALLGWSTGDNVEILNLNEMIERFDFKNLHKAGARFDKKKAEWLNKQHIMKLSDDDFVMLIFNSLNINNTFLGDYIHKLQYSDVNISGLLTDNYKTLLNIVPLIRTKIDSLNDIAFYIKPLLYDNINCNNDNLDEKIISGLSTLKENILKLEHITPETIELCYKNVLANNEYLNTNKKVFMKAFRNAVTGEDIGASVYHLISFIGIEKTDTRLNNYININKTN